MHYVTIAILLVTATIISAKQSSSSPVYAVSTNCTSDSIPCGGPTPFCCAPGLVCNFRRGIPLCQDNSIPFTSGFSPFSQTCADPYLFPCDGLISVPGFCCPIGSLCVRKGTGSSVQCVNAVGATLAALPSATTGVIPSSTPISPESNLISYSPPSVWKTVSAQSNCTTSPTLHSTDVINATVSFNYTGPSIMVHTVTSATGGVFSLIIDGFNTTTVIDTYRGPGDLAIPECSPRQFPGFAVIPPGYANSTSHTVSLVYIGPSMSSPANTSSTIQFDAFSIPDFSAASLNGVGGREREAIQVIPAILAVGLSILSHVLFYVV